MKPWITCFDLEGVLVPEVWINVAEKTGLPELRLTTRDVADYDELMRHRLAVLDANGLRLPDIQAVIATIEPMPGAREFLDELRARQQVMILSDTFEEFAGPLMAQLGRPAILCHSLEVDASGRITNYRLRLPDQKRAAALAFQALGYQVSAVGDSYNDTAMLLAADLGILFRPPDNVIEEFPTLPVVTGYDELAAALARGQARVVST